MNKFDIALVVDLQKEGKEVGLFATDYKMFERLFAERFDLMEYFNQIFERFEFKKDFDRRGFWTYWTTQGNMLWSLMGPYSITSDLTLPQFCSKWVSDLSGLVKEIKKQNIPLAIEGD